ncbi:unnamed protein product [Prorocentrum cordatum]|uniref:Uncharacterized protein n=1 Tax=Prorocentrum cordatum TaxID=2364126 RepID=A0ABN9S7D1_9DINO|nr:unnamed protein product [Polarella glacialis]
MGFGWGKGGGFWSKTTADAIKEIKAQLIDQGGTGKVWVDDWGRRFQPELGTLRQFLEARYDKFQINPGKGASFTVSLVGYYPDEGHSYGSYSGSWGKGSTSKGQYSGYKGEYKPTWQLKEPTETYTGGGSKYGKRWVPKDNASQADEETSEVAQAAAAGPSSSGAQAAAGPTGAAASGAAAGSASKEEPRADADADDGERPLAFDDPVDDLDSPK